MRVPRHLLMVVLFLVLATAPIVAAPSRLRVVQWSDVHYGSNQWAEGAWREAEREGIAARADVYVITGDQVDNKCEEKEFVQRHEVFLTSLGKSLAPLHRPVMLALGNNDFFPNYQTTPQALRSAFESYRRWFPRFYYLDEAGNGVHPERAAGMAWITINSVIFSPHNHCAVQDEQARRTLEWLKRQLARLPAGQTAVILSHVAPTVDVYDQKPSWRAVDLERFQAVLEGHPGDVVILSGHYHRNEIHALRLSSGRAVPILAAGSLSAKFETPPNWRTYVWDFTTAGRLEQVTYRVLYPDHPAWQSLWSIREPFRQATYERLARELVQIPARYMRYMADFFAHHADWRKRSDSDYARTLILDEIFTPAGRGAPTGRRGAITSGGRPGPAPWAHCLGGR